MFPHIFLTPHFLTDQQKTELTASKHRKILAKTKAFSDSLKNRDGSEQLSFLYKASDMVMSNATAKLSVLSWCVGHHSLIVAKSLMTSSSLPA